MANSNGWGDGAANNAIGWGQGANNAIGWGDSHAKSWAGLTDIVGITTTPVDADAQAFITAAAITNPTQQAAINTLVVDLKGYNIWSKFNAIYPMVGGTSTSTSYNLKNTAQHQITWSGGVTHSSTGVTFNGTNGYGNTNLTADFLPQNSAHMSFYSRTNNTTGGLDMGQNDTAGTSYSYLSFYNTSILKGALTINNSAVTPLNEATFTNTLGFMIGSRTTSTMLKMFRNTTKTESNLINSTTPQTVNIFIGARNNGGVAANYVNKQCAFASAGTGLTDTEAANFYTAVNAFQVALSRNV